jgi:putative MATE family efflux protein
MTDLGRKSLFSMTWPIFLELILQMLVGNVDQIMISRYSQNSVAAIGNANQILNVLLLTFNVISIATIILVSQYKGANDTKRIGQVYSLALLTNFCFSFIIAGILLGFNKQIFGWMQVPAEILAESSTYISIVGGVIFLQAIALTFSAIFRSNGWLRAALSITVVVNITNVIGNALLIHGIGPIPPLGLVGVAISSNIARLLGIGIYIYVFKKRSEISLSFSSLKPFPWRMEKKLLSIGLPSGGESLSYSSAQMCILRFVNTMGTYVVTASVYSKMFAMLSYVYTSAIAQANQVLVGYYMGAGRLDKVQDRVSTSLKTAITISLLMSTLIYAVSQKLFSFFSPNPEVVRLGRLIMLIDIPLEAGRAVNMVIIRALQAAGDIRFPVVSGIMCVWGIEVCLAYIFGIHFGLGLVGVWLAMAFDECFRACIYLYRWKGKRWQTYNLTKD